MVLNIYTIALAVIGFGLGWRQCTKFHAFLIANGIIPPLGLYCLWGVIGALGTQVLIMVGKMILQM